MNRGIKKILSYLPAFCLECYDMIFESAAENHIRLTKAEVKKFRSYTQLKRQQKKIRTYVGLFLMVAFSWMLGIFVAPIFYPQPIESEVYIPNGKGDILIANVSKNQATVIFKTLDSANNNKPLATKATVEFYEDAGYQKLTRRSPESDYAVTHTVPVDFLQEGLVYYVRIIARDAAMPQHTKEISSWGGGGDPIRVYTTGELIPTCAQAVAEPVTVSLASEIEEIIDAQIAPSLDDPENAVIKSDELQILEVQNENYLQPRNKIQTIISWKTNIPATAVLIYAEEGSMEQQETAPNEQLQLKHQIVLTSLKAGTTYYFKVKSLDKDGLEKISEEYSLRTPRAEETVVEKIGDNFKSMLRQIKPR